MERLEALPTRPTSLRPLMSYITKATPESAIANDALCAREFGAYWAPAHVLELAALQVSRFVGMANMAAAGVEGIDRAECEYLAAVWRNVRRIARAGEMPRCIQHPHEYDTVIDGLYALNDERLGEIPELEMGTVRE